MALRRVAMISVHTSPLATPGSGDAGGMNVYVAETARRLAARGIEVDVFTRATSARQPAEQELAPGVTVRHVVAGPFEGLGKMDLPGQLCAFAAGVMRTEAHRPAGHYDLVHSHYWLSGQVGWLAADRWQVPLVHTMHTMAKVKNLSLASGDSPEPPGREIGEEQVVEAADELVANTDQEARELVDLYGASPDRVAIVPPGVDLDVFRPVELGVEHSVEQGVEQSVERTPQAQRATDRAALGLAPDAVVLLFVGRIQPLKAPDVLVRAAGDLLARRPELRDRLVVAILGGDSGGGYGDPDFLRRLAAEHGLADAMRWVVSVTRPELAQWYRASDVLAVPSYNESFGLVALEALACGAQVVATRVGGLPTAVGDAGTLVDGHDPADWSRAIETLVDRSPDERTSAAERAVAHAQEYSWEATVDRLVASYEAAAEHQRVAAAEHQRVAAAEHQRVAAAEHQREAAAEPQRRELDGPAA